MSLITLPAPIFYPLRFAEVFTVGSSSQFEVDASGEVAKVQVQAPFTGNIAKIGLRLGTVATGDTIEVGLYQVDPSSGPPAPVGAIWDTNTTNTGVVVDAADDGKWLWVTLAAVAAVVLGDDLYIKIVNGTLGDIQFSTSAFAQTGKPYMTEGATGSFNSTPICAFEDDGGVVYQPQGCLIAGNEDGDSGSPVESIDNGTTPDHWGVRFQVPFATRLCGFMVDTNDADGDGTWYLVAPDWDGTGGDAIESYAFDHDVRANGTGAPIEVLFATKTTLTINTWYRLVFVPSDTTNTGLSYRTLPDAASLAASFGGDIFHVTEGKDPTQDSEWTDYDNVTDGFRIPSIALLLDQFDDGAGGGGGIAAFDGNTQMTSIVEKQGI